MVHRSTSKETLGSMFFGTAFSYMLHGIADCQMIWYFRSQAGSTSRTMKALIVWIWINETLNCIFMFFSTLNALLGPAIAYGETHSNPCGYWGGPTQIVTSALCTFSVESFFIMRVLKLSEQKKLMALTIVPYLTGHAFGIAQIVRSYRYLCDSNVSALALDSVYVFGTFGPRLVGDGVIAAAMSYTLYIRSSGVMRHTNAIKIVRGLILWSISTGLLTCVTSVLFLISYSGVLPSASYAIYYMRGGIYANAMLAQLNDRPRFQEMAQASIPLESIKLSETPVDRPEAITE